MSVDWYLASMWEMKGVKEAMVTLLHFKTATTQLPLIAVGKIWAWLAAPLFSTDVGWLHANATQAVPLRPHGEGPALALVLCGHHCKFIVIFEPGCVCIFILHWTPKMLYPVLFSREAAHPYFPVIYSNFQMLAINSNFKIY